MKTYMQKTLLIPLIFMAILAAIICPGQEKPQIIFSVNAQNVDSNQETETGKLGLFRPDSPLYLLQRAGERLKLLLTQNPIERAKYELTLIERRVAELHDLVERGRLTVKRAEALQKKTERLIEDVERRIEFARQKGLDVQVLNQRMQTILNRQQTVLEGVLNRVPEEARGAIQRAIEVFRISPLPSPPIRRTTPVPTPTPKPTPTPEPKPTPTPTPKPTPTPTPKPTPTPTPTPTPITSPSPSPVSPAVINITVEADDNGLYPATITVQKGAMINLTFLVRSSNVYYGGLEFRSPKFRTPPIFAGGSNSVTFTADESFTYSSYWPRSNVKKADGRVEVK